MFIENIAAYVKIQLQNGAEIISAVKIVPVKIRQGTIGKNICTKIDVNWLETENSIRHADDVIVCGSHGEEYILSAAEFSRRYQPDPNKQNLWIPKPIVQKFIYLTENISFKAPWGNIMHMCQGDVLNITDKHNIYGIAASVFATDYR